MPHALRRGFSMMELLVAVAVLAIGILGISSTLALGSRAEGQAARITEATAWSRQIVDLMRARNLCYAYLPALPPASSGLNDGASARVALNAAPFASDLPAVSGITRNIRVEWISTSANDYRYQMVKITVGIYWIDRGAEKKVEFQAIHRQP